MSTITIRLVQYQCVHGGEVEHLGSSKSEYAAWRPDYDLCAMPQRLDLGRADAPPVSVST